ncbi:DUF6531 domain-containing protein [Sphaerisporangium sp. NPDC051017]|uniref:DUF6531 domain-containing protein n=1 Tax=Sphaerisporangium sp. NPDC051017 TaxID=3154636 RepID=UPI00342BE768
MSVGHTDPERANPRATSTIPAASPPADSARGKELARIKAEVAKAVTEPESSSTPPNQAPAARPRMPEINGAAPQPQAGAATPRVAPASARAGGPRITTASQVALATTSAATYGAEYYPGAFLADRPVTNNAAGKLAFRVVNRSDFTWQDGPVKLSYWVYDTANNLITKDGARTPLPLDVPPNTALDFTADLGPLSPGDGSTKSKSYKIAWNLVEGDATWFSEHGVASPVVTYTVFNQFPNVTVKAPANEASVETTRPTLSVSGNDPDAYPGSLRYQYKICARTGPTNGQCQTSAWTTGDSYVPPLNSLYWNTTYEWSVTITDGLDTTTPSVSNYFTTVVPNPDQAERYGMGTGSASVADVNLPIGNYVTSAPQISLPTYGIGMSLVPTYNSLDDRDGSFGVGWSSLLDARVDRSPDPAGGVLFTHPDGRQERFGCDPNGRFVPSVGSGTATRVFATGTHCGGWLFVYVGPVIYKFDLEGRLQSITSRSNETDVWAFGYDGSQGLPTRIVHPITGRGLRIVWSAGNVIRVDVTFQPPGQDLRVLQAWKYTYTTPGGAGRQYLNTVVPPTSTGIRYEYSTTGARPLLSWVTPPDSTPTRVIGYNSSGRVSLVSDGHEGRWQFTYTSVGGSPLPRQVLVTNPRGGRATWHFDSVYHLVQRDGENGGSRYWLYWPGADGPTGNLSGAADENGNVLHTAYDAFGRLVGRSVYAGDGSESLEYTAYEYGSSNPEDPRFDQLTSMTDPRGGGSSPAYRTTFEYDAFGQLTARWAPPDTGGQRAWTQYYYTVGDESAYGGGVVPHGLVRRVIAPGRTDLEYSYDSRGQLRQTQERRSDTTSGFGRRTVYDYDDSGRLSGRTEYGDAVTGPVTTTYGYDVVGNLVRETQPRVRNQVTGVDHQLQTDYTYDQMYRLTSTKISDVAGDDPDRITTYTYDASSRMRTITYPGGGTATYEYDDAGNLTKATDQSGTVTQMAYNAADQVTSVVLKNLVDDPVAGSTPRDVYIGQYAYDLGGRMVENTDALGRTRRYHYLPSDRLDKVTLLGFHNPNGSRRDLPIVDYDYDRAGNVVKTTEFGTRVTTTTFDGLSRPLKIVEDPGGLRRTTDLVYDGLGNLTTRRVSDGGGRTEETRYGYDARGLPIFETVENGDTDLTTRVSYDDWGLVNSSSDARGNRTEYTYDALGRQVTAIAPTVPIDEFGKATANARPQAVTGYNTFGEVTHSKDPRGNVAESTFDIEGRRVRYLGPPQPAPDGGTVRPTGTWAYDKLGNVLEETDLRGTTVSYRYDKLGRLYQKIDPLLPGESTRRSTRMRYDDLGNMVGATDQSGASQEWQWDDLDRQSVSTDVDRQAGSDVLRYSTKYFYDDLGNMTRALSPGGLELLRTYDTLGRLLTETQPGTATCAGSPASRSRPRR